jgi:hypothetical protein
MAEYLENKVIGSYFRAPTNQFYGVIRIFGTYTEYRVIEGIPEEGVMLEVVNVQHGVLHTRVVNNILFENGRGFLLC